MAASASPAWGQRRKPDNLAKLNHSPTMGRFSVVNHFNRSVAKLAPTTAYPRLKAFLPQNLLPWLSSYLKDAFTPRYPFPDYSGSGKTGGYPIAPAAGSDRITIAIAGDWATGTQEAQTIADLMSAGSPDFTIHLGDVYYVGDQAEIEETCFGRSTDQFRGVTWPFGSRGSFALNGNHEMYANGIPYFTTFLPKLGVSGDSPGQVTSFFCLEAGGWRMIGIDTGYNSVGIPILSQIPGLNTIASIGGDCHLEDALMTWLRNVVRPHAPERRKPTLLLSHHQYFTAFEDHAYTKPAKQLMEFFEDQDVVWLWGHEHRLGIYDRFAADGGITAFGRCLGHGGMPVDLGIPDASKAPLKLYDPRSHKLDNEVEVGQNGFVNVTIQQDVLTLDYRDIDNTQLLVETFRPGAKGTLDYGFTDPAGILKPPPQRP